jgi:hypothetical protein
MSFVIKAAGKQVMAELTRDQTVKQWLTTLGYVGEMKVAGTLISSGFEVVKSSFYEDPENQGTTREINLIGRMSDSMDLLQVFSVIECKRSTNPWVVLTSEYSSFNRLGAFAIMSKKANQSISNNLLHMLEVDWFVKNGRLGYGITESFNKKEDAIFSAMLNSTKASISIIKQEMKSYKSDYLTFIFPTIVLDGSLFESYLGAGDQLKLAETDSSFVYFPINIGGYTCSGIRVITLKAFDRYCADLKSLYQTLNNILILDVKRGADAIR